MGSPTITNDAGEQQPAPFGNSAYFAPSMGVFSRRKFYEPKKKSKKKKIQEFIDFYFEN
jgi:hypothetical protein